MPDTKPLDVFQLHSLPIIADHLEKTVADIERYLNRHKKRASIPAANLRGMRISLQTILPLITAQPQRERVTNLMTRIGN